MERTRSSILTVDDEPVVHTVIQKALRNSNYELLFAKTCEEALAVARSTTSIEVALVDKNLPDGSGLDIIKDLKAHQPDIEVLLITGYPSVESAVEALRVGAFDYIEKPLDSINILKLRLQNALERVALKRHQKNLLDELRRQKELYERAIHGSNDGIWDWDLRSNTMYFSSRWKNMIGYDENLHDDHPVDTFDNSPNEWFSRVHKEDMSRVREAIASHLDSRSDRLEVEYRIRNKDGDYRRMRSRGLVVRDRKGVAKRLSGTQTDITDHRRRD